MKPEKLKRRNNQEKSDSKKEQSVNLHFDATRFVLRSWIYLLVQPETTGQRTGPTVQRDLSRWEDSSNTVWSPSFLFPFQAPRIRLQSCRSPPPDSHPKEPSPRPPSLQGKARMSRVKLVGWNSSFIPSEMSGHGDCRWFTMILTTFIQTVHGSCKPSTHLSRLDSLIYIRKGGKFSVCKSVTWQSISMLACFSQFPGSLSVSRSGSHPWVFTNRVTSVFQQGFFFSNIGVLPLLAVVIQTGVSAVNKTVTAQLPVTVVKQQENKQQNTHTETFDLRLRSFVEWRFERQPTWRTHLSCHAYSRDGGDVQANTMLI